MDKEHKWKSGGDEYRVGHPQMGGLGGIVIQRRPLLGAA